VRLLLDTHTLLWWLADDPTLAGPARDSIADPASRVFVSAASAWEMAIKRSLGKLEAPSDLERQLERSRFEPLAITIPHAHAAGSLPRHHDDPFDRMLVAQARAEDLTIVTRDLRFGPYGVGTLLA
jgi:PIN domain nuclease of toxin-antitoxin system